MTRDQGKITLFPLRQDLSANGDLARLADQKAPGCSCLHLTSTPVLGLLEYKCPRFLMAGGDLNLGPCAYTASTLIHWAIPPAPTYKYWWTGCRNSIEQIYSYGLYKWHVKLFHHKENKTTKRYGAEINVIYAEVLREKCIMLCNLLRNDIENYRDL